MPNNEAIQVVACEADRAGLIARFPWRFELEEGAIVIVADVSIYDKRHDYLRAGKLKKHAKPKHPIVSRLPDARYTEVAETIVQHHNLWLAWGRGSDVAAAAYRNTMKEILAARGLLELTPSL